MKIGLIISKAKYASGTTTALSGLKMASASFIGPFNATCAAITATDPQIFKKDTTMKTKYLAHAMFASSLLLSSAASFAGDDTFDKQKDAAEERLDKAQDDCEKFTGNAQDTCEAKAKATYEQEILSFEKQQETREKPANPVPSNTPAQRQQPMQ